jgi:hypothetical protein
MISQRILEIMRKIKRAADILLDTKRGRSITVFPEDIFVVSYPKSGNTWMRFLIGNLLFQDEPITFFNIENKIPDIYKNTNRKLLQISPPRILKSHEYFDPRYKKVIYIVRDPRDVAVSYYYHCIKFRIIKQTDKMDRFLNQFIEGKIDNFGSWEENVGSWIGARKGDPNFLLLRYEDIMNAAEDALKKIAVHLEIDATYESIVRAVGLSSFDRMKKLEKKQSDEWMQTKKSNKNLMFVRKGQCGGWKKELSKEESEKIEKAWKHLMLMFGYLT